MPSRPDSSSPLCCVGSEVELFHARIQRTRESKSAMGVQKTEHESGYFEEDDEEDDDVDIVFEKSIVRQKVTRESNSVECIGIVNKDVNGNLSAINGESCPSSYQERIWDDRGKNFSSSRFLGGRS